jgi:uncharacterized protein YjbI with pentapeptide repeats
VKWPGWTGVGERTYQQPDGTVVQPSKTAWDWLQLLIVPAFLVLAVTFYNGSQTAQQNRRSVQTAQDTILDAYFLQMSNLMLHDDLLHPAKGSAVRAVGDAITGAAITRLDTARQVEVAAFLSEANVQGANLAAANLADANLSFAYLKRAILTRANLNGAGLSGANLQGANLRDANLNGANLTFADLQGAFLTHTHLDGANLDGANLNGGHTELATFTGATFQNTICPNGTITNTGC